MQVNAKNLDHVRAAIYLFGGVYAGLALPLAAQTQSKWRIATGPRGEPGSWGGHAVPYCGYTATEITCVTWGAKIRLTNAFHAKYAEEAYAIVSPDFLAAGVSPAGFDLETLRADLLALT